MEDKNLILLDESYNDALMVKEVSTYLKNHIRSGKPISKKFVQDIMDIVLKNSEINFKSVSFTDKTDVAAWNAGYQKFRFNIAAIVNQAKSLHKSRPYGERISDPNIYKYFFILECIFHELTHARQDYVREHYSHDIYTDCEDFINQNGELYQLFHDEVLIERYANLRGTTLAYKTLSYVYPKEKIRSFKNLIFNYLFYGYKINNEDEVFTPYTTWELYHDSNIISAADLYYSLSNIPQVEIDIDEDSIDFSLLDPKEILLSVMYRMAIDDPVYFEGEENMSLYDRLYLGCSLTPEELYNLNWLYAAHPYLEDRDLDVQQLIMKMENQQKN